MFRQKFRLALQDYISDNADWRESLKKDPYNLIISEKDELVLFKYVQFASDFSIPLVRECRGIILNSQTLEVVCYAFNKFGNYGESYAYPIELNNSYVIEKVDGSIIRLYFYNGEWRVATNGTIDARDALTMNGDMNFRDLFDDIVSLDELIPHLHRSYTYMFEMVHPVSRIVVDYAGKKELVLIGCRDMESGRDMDIFNFGTFFSFLGKVNNIRLPNKFELNSISDIDELIGLADEINKNGVDFEGFVVAERHHARNEIIGRVKIKSPKYLKFHRLTGGKGVSNNVVQILLDRENDEIEAYLKDLPAYIADTYRELRGDYDAFLVHVKGHVAHYQAMKDDLVGDERDIRKEIAIDVQSNHSKWMLRFVMAVLFSGRDIEEMLRDMGSKKVRSLLENWRGRAYVDWNNE